MKSTAKQLLFAAPILFAVIIGSSAFTTVERNTIANGGGMAGDIHFNFNAVEQKDGSVVGHIQYDGTYYTVTCAEWFDDSAILYAEDAFGNQLAFMVTDNGEGNGVTDQISQPVPWEDCDELDATYFTLSNVTAGNIQVK